MADRRFFIPSGAQFSTRTSADDTDYSVVKFTTDITGNGPVQCDVTKYKNATVNSAGAVEDTKSFKGKGKMDGKKFRATLHDESDKISIFKLVLIPHHVSPVRDRLILNKTTVKVLKDVDSIDDSISTFSIFISMLGSGMADPDAESFNRVGVVTGSPTDGVAAGNKTTPLQYKIQKNTVTVKDGNGFVIAYDNGAGMLVASSDGSTMLDSSVTYAKPWSVQVDKSANIYSVEALVDG